MVSYPFQTRFPGIFVEFIESDFIFNGPQHGVDKNLTEVVDYVIIN